MHHPIMPVYIMLIFEFPVWNTNILDLACGTGGIITWLDKENNYTGLDISFDMLKRTAKRAQKKV